MLSAQTASIACNDKGEVNIAFDDLAYARADTIFLDERSSTISGLIDGLHVEFGKVSKADASQMAKLRTVRLSAPHPQGHQLFLIAALQTTH